MKLVIVESPNKIKKIQEFLGSDFTIKASVGHIRDLPKSNKKAINIEDGFIPTYEVDSKKAHIISDLSKLSKKANAVYLATDPDREGEAISWHLKEALGLKEGYERITFTSITKEAVEEALAHPRKIDMNLVRAQEARRVLDRLVGYDLSGIIWKKVRYGLSAGRVQSPALRIIMEREREIRAFIPEKFYKITGEFTHGKIPLTLECSLIPTEKSEAERIVESGEKEKKWVVVDVEETEVKRSPKAPFTTSTLQQSASSFLGYSPKKTMMIAQKLYEKGLITYMRTDSPTLSPEAIRDIAGTIKKMYGEENLEVRVFKSKSKNAQEAHEAVRPTHLFDTHAGTTDEEKRLYKLIWSRTVASQMKDAKIQRTKVIANKSETGSDIPDFSINGSVILFPGWMAVDPELDTEENKLPLIKKGDTHSLLSLYNEEK
jgi:DNA topoisomerase-1